MTPPSFLAGLATHFLPAVVSALRAVSPMLSHETLLDQLRALDKQVDSGLLRQYIVESIVEGYPFKIPSRTAPDVV